jgi:hypothetical protein
MLATTGRYKFDPTASQRPSRFKKFISQLLDQASPPSPLSAVGSSLTSPPPPQIHLLHSEVSSREIYDEIFSNIFYRIPFHTHLKHKRHSAQQYIELYPHTHNNYKGNQKSCRISGCRTASVPQTVKHTMNTNKAIVSCCRESTCSTGRFRSWQCNVYVQRRAVKHGHREDRCTGVYVV